MTKNGEAIEQFGRCAFILLRKKEMWQRHEAVNNDCGFYVWHDCVWSYECPLFVTCVLFRNCMLVVWMGLKLAQLQSATATCVRTCSVAVLCELIVRRPKWLIHDVNPTIFFIAICIKKRMYIRIIESIMFLLCVFSRFLCLFCCYLFAKWIATFKFVCVCLCLCVCVCVQSLVSQMEQEARVMDAIKYVQAERERGWIFGSVIDNDYRNTLFQAFNRQTMRRGQATSR